MGWIAGESKACRAFLFNEVSNRGPQRFMGRMILTTLKNGPAWAGEIGEGRVDSRDADREFKAKISRMLTRVTYFLLFFTKSHFSSLS